MAAYAFNFTHRNHSDLETLRSGEKPFRSVADLDDYGYRSLCCGTIALAATSDSDFQRRLDCVARCILVNRRPSLDQRRRSPELMLSALSTARGARRGKDHVDFLKFRRCANPVHPSLAGKRKGARRRRRFCANLDAPRPLEVALRDLQCGCGPSLAIDVGQRRQFDRKDTPAFIPQDGYAAAAVRHFAPQSRRFRYLRSCRKDHRPICRKSTTARLSAASRRAPFTLQDLARIQVTWFSFRAPGTGLKGNAVRCA